MNKIKYILPIFLLLFFANTFAQEESKTPQELADPNGNFIRVDGVEIYYIAEGNPENPAVILLHGFGGSTFTWRDTIQPVAEAGFYTLAIDLPPFGLSEKSADIDYTRAGMATLVAGFLDELNIERATIVGHSMGGAVTAYFAVNHPEKVAQLVFVAGGVGDSQTSTAQTNNQTQSSPMAFLANINPTSPLAVGLLETLLTPERLNEMLFDAYYQQHVLTDAVQAGYHRPLLVEDWAIGFLAYMQAEETQIVELYDLMHVNAPKLLIWGEEDTWVPIQLGQQMVLALPNSTLISYPQVGHLPMEENAEQFNQDLITFLQNQ